MKIAKTLLSILLAFSYNSLADEPSTNNFLQLRFQEPSQIYTNNIKTNNFLQLRFQPPKDPAYNKITYAPQHMNSDKGVLMSIESKR